MQSLCATSSNKSGLHTTSNSRISGTQLSLNSFRAAFISPEEEAEYSEAAHEVSAPCLQGGSGPSVADWLTNFVKAATWSALRL